MTPDRARTEPTLRSMPAVMMTTVSPIPRSPITELWRSTVMALFMLRKLSLTMLNPTISRTSDAKADSL